MPSKLDPCTGNPVDKLQTTWPGLRDI